MDLLVCYLNSFSFEFVPQNFYLCINITLNKYNKTVYFSLTNSYSKAALSSIKKLFLS
jgi:hypothetical protein